LREGAARRLQRRDDGLGGCGADRGGLSPGGGGSGRRREFSAVARATALGPFRLFPGRLYRWVTRMPSARLLIPRVGRVRRLGPLPHPGDPPRQERSRRSFQYRAAGPGGTGKVLGNHLSLPMDARRSRERILFVAGRDDRIMLPDSVE